MRHAMSPRAAIKVSPRSPHQELINDEYESISHLNDDVGGGIAYTNLPQTPAHILHVQAQLR